MARPQEYRPGSHVELGARGARQAYRIIAVTPMVTAHAMLRVDLVRLVDDGNGQFTTDETRRYRWIGRKGARIPWNAALFDVAPDVPETWTRVAR